MPDNPPARLQVHDTRLPLFRAAVREIAWIEIYRCALYLPSGAAPPTDPGVIEAPLAFHVTVLADDDDPEMPDSWESRLRAEVSDRVFARMRRTYRKLDKGDVVIIDFAPGHGSSVRLNGETVLHTPDSSLIAVLVAQWLGPEPVSADLREELGGAPAARDNRAISDDNIVR